MARKRRNLQDRIKGKYEQKGEDECWPWTGAKTSAGYGHLLADGNPNGQRKTVLAHRAIFELFNGPIPEGAVLDHTCHNKDLSCPGNKECKHRACVNPAHGEPVSFGENCLRGRGISARNKVKTHCNNGHEYTDATMRLTKQGIRECIPCAKARLRRWKQRNPGYVSPAKRKRAAERAANRVDLR